MRDKVTAARFEPLICMIIKTELGSVEVGGLQGVAHVQSDVIEAEKIAIRLKSKQKLVNGASIR